MAANITLTLGDLAGEWRKDALCKGMDPNFFHPPSGTREERENRKFCWACPVRTFCLDWALETNQRDGIWGGHTVRERKSQRRLNRIEQFYKSRESA